LPQNFSNGTDTRIPQNLFLAFLMQFRVQRAGALHVVSNTVVNITVLLCDCVVCERHRQVYWKRWSRTWSPWKVDGKRHGMSADVEKLLD